MITNDPGVALLVAAVIGAGPGYLAIRRTTRDKDDKAHRAEVREETRELLGTTLKSVQEVVRLQANNEDLREQLRDCIAAHADP